METAKSLELILSAIPLAKRRELRAPIEEIQRRLGVKTDYMIDRRAGGSIWSARREADRSWVIESMSSGAQFRVNISEACEVMRVTEANLKQRTKGSASFARVQPLRVGGDPEKLICSRLKPELRHLGAESPPDPQIVALVQHLKQPQSNAPKRSRF